MSTPASPESSGANQPDPANFAVGEFGALADDARAGCSESLGSLIERCRNYLLLVANQGLDADLRVKVGASDLVQETLLAARQGFDRFHGASEDELRLWLRRILINKIATARRAYYDTEKRNLSREQSLSDLPAGAQGVPALVNHDQTPRQLAIASERALAIERTLTNLPDHYRAVIRRRCFELESFNEIGRAMNVSGDAARKLWCRAIERLRREWDSSDESR